MQNTNINTYVEKAISIKISQHHSWCVSIPSTPSLITRFINFKLLPPPQRINTCNNTQVNEQAKIGSNCQSFIAPVRSPFNLENVWAILFQEVGILSPNIY